MKDIENMNMQEAAAMQRKIFADRLRILRNNAGLTQKQLAERGGFQPPAIARYEAGQVLPRPDAVGRLAGALGVPVSSLDGSDGTAALKIKISDFWTAQLKLAGLQVVFKDNFNTAIVSGPDVEEVTLSFRELEEIIFNIEADVSAQLAPLRIKYFKSFAKLKFEVISKSKNK